MANDNVSDQLKKLEQLLDEYENKLFISKIRLREPKLDVSREEMQSMSEDDLQLLRWEYAAYALYIQKEINKHNSRLTWTDTNLKRYLELYANDYEGFQWSERQAAVLNNNEYAQKLHKLKLNTRAVLDRLAFIPEKLKFLNEIARDICFTKRKYKDE